MQNSSKPLSPTLNQESVYKKKSSQISTVKEASKSKKKTNNVIKSKSLQRNIKKSTNNIIKANAKGAVKKNTGKEVKKDKKKNVSKPKYLSEIQPTGYTQSLMGVKQIYSNGMIKTTDGKYVMIMEIFPVNYMQKNDNQKKAIINNFASFFEICPSEGQFKSIMETTDEKMFINHLLQACPNSPDNKRMNTRNAIIKNIKNIASNYTLNYRYFFIFKYESGVDGKRSTNLDEISSSMMVQKYSIKNIFENCGNLVSDLSPENARLTVIDFLFHYYNRNSCSNESILSRVYRIENDYKNYCKANDIKFNYDLIDITDYFAPKGVVFNGSEYNLQDGLYETYFTITDIGYPENVIPDWVSIARNNIGDALLDIDFDYKKLDTTLLIDSLQRKNTWNKVSYNSATKDKKKEKYSSRYSNTKFIIDSLNAGESLFDCMVTYKLMHKDPKALLVARDLIKKNLSSYGIRTEESFLDTEEYYRINRPLCEFSSSIFDRNKRNMTTPAAAESAYDMTTYTLSDPEGIVMGPNYSNGTIFAFNNFNTDMFKNGNINIFGTPGSGKTCLQLAIAARQLVNGNKVYFILPTKGYEYQKAVDEWGGQYISLSPGSEYSINIMEIYPYTDGDDLKNSASLLTKKITSLTTWFKMLCVQEKNPNFYMTSMDINKMNSVLSVLYSDFGITDDNQSIWKDMYKGIKKRMPIIGDWYERLKGDPTLDKYKELLLPFIKGTFKNFNQQTNIDMSSDCIAFDIEYDNIGETMHPIIMYIAYDFVMNAIKMDKYNFGICIIDEAWKLMIDETSAKQIEKEIRLIRGYGGAIILATQNVNEFVNSTYGENILSCSEITIFLQMKENEFNKINEIYHLSNDEKSFLVKAILNSNKSAGGSVNAKGKALFYCNGNKIRFQLKISDYELSLYTTDLNVKRRLAKNNK